MTRTEIEAPYGYFEEDGVTKAPRAVVRVGKTEVGGVKTVDLVAVERIPAGDVILAENPLLAWGKDIDIAQQGSDSDKILVQRCVAIKKMAAAMKTVGVFCDSTLPYVQRYCATRSRKGDTDTIWNMPWQIRDTTMDEEKLKLMTSFCVLTQRGFTKTIHETAFKDIPQISRLCVIAEKGSLDLPSGKGIFKYTSAAKRMAAAKPKLQSVGARPRSKKSIAAQEVPTPNADYVFTDEGKLVLRAKREIKFGDIISIPLVKIFSDAREDSNPLVVLQDKKKLKDAALHKAAHQDAPDILKKLAETEHPRVAPRQPPRASLAIPSRDVTQEVWREAVSADVTYFDYIFNTDEASNLLSVFDHEGVPKPMPFHIGFESHSRMITGDVFASVIRILFTRAAKFLPKTVVSKDKTLSLSGVASQGMFLRLTPGEELLPLAMQTGLAQGVGVPTAIMVTGNGSLKLKDDTHAIPFKPGRVVTWTEGITHAVPVTHSGDCGVMFTYLMYQ
eukprot:TRINITY_DN30342_c0_g1_i1.p1 TRINITY_DN30342_c0_g1~~TRINITY_DN30342_c0_g1_i1.p1  ORF type:complete len:512 (+),score=102.45 TRINITY_DN30342_c0_g1_i1:29-1537(+)